MAPRWFALVLVSFAVACGGEAKRPPTVPAGAPGPGSTVASSFVPAFDWPESLAAKVHVSRRMTRGFAGRVEDKESSATMLLTTSRVDGERSVRYSHLEPANGSRPVAELLDQTLPMVLVDLRLSAENEYVRTVGLEETMAGIIKLGEAAEKEKFAEFFRTFDVEFFQSFARREWDWLVGYWDGRKFEPGTSGSAEILLGGDQTPVVAQFSAGALETCPGGSDPNACVRLSMVVERTGADCEHDGFVRVFLTSVYQAAGDPNAEFESCGLHVETLSEVATLIPHKQSQTQFLRTVIVDDGKTSPPFVVKRVVDRTMVY